MDLSNNDAETSEEVENLTWGTVTGNHLKKFLFGLDCSGIREEVYTHYKKSPYEFYKMLITDEIINHIVSQTNLYIEQEKSKVTTSKHS